jgi:hypothetical protein
MAHDYRALEFIAEVEAIMGKYKTEQTRHDHLRRLCNATYRAGHKDALAELGEAVIGGRVFGGVTATPLGKALGEALQTDDEGGI